MATRGSLYRVLSCNSELKSEHETYVLHYHWNHWVVISTSCCWQGRLLLWQSPGSPVLTKLTLLHFLGFQWFNAIITCWIFNKIPTSQCEPGIWFLVWVQNLISLVSLPLHLNFRGFRKFPISLNNRYTEEVPLGSVWKIMWHGLWKLKLRCKMTIQHYGFPVNSLIWAPSQYKDRLIYVWRFPC